MSQLFYFCVTVSVILVTYRASAFTGGLCEQEQSWRDTLCNYISNGASRSADLLSLSRNTIPSGVAKYNFKNPENVSTLDSLHQEIELYYQTLSSLLSSMNAYNGTPAYRKEAVVIAAVDRAALCKNLLNDVLADLRPMKIQLSCSASPNAEPRPATTASPLTRLSQFCRESNHVMQTLVPVLQKWHDKCRECASTGRR